MTLNFNYSSLLALISTGDLTANKIFHHTSSCKSVQQKLNKLNAMTDQKKELKKAKALGCVVSYIMKHKEFNPGSAYVPKQNIYMNWEFQNNSILQGSRRNFSMNTKLMLKNY